MAAKYYNIVINKHKSVHVKKVNHTYLNKLIPLPYQERLTDSKAAR